jgi:hypothetical protein
MSERTIRTRCVCGWETSGSVEAVVQATIEHGRRLHNMDATPDQVLAMAEPVAEGDDAGALQDADGQVDA